MDATVNSILPTKTITRLPLSPLDSLFLQGISDLVSGQKCTTDCDATLYLSKNRIPLFTLNNMVNHPLLALSGKVC